MTKTIKWGIINNGLMPKMNKGSIDKKERDMIRIAIAVEDKDVSPQFGRCKKFCLVNIDGQQIISRHFINNPVPIPGFMPDFLAVKYVDCVITGWIDEKAMEMLNANGIDVITGAKGMAEEVIELFTKGDLIISKKQAINLVKDFPLKV